MKEILFKGKRVDNRQWVEGGIIPLDPDCLYMFIIELYPRASTLSVQNLINNCLYRVDPTTVCQYTGKSDKNAEKIWEHDVVLISREDGLFVVQWDNDTARYIIAGDGIIFDFDNYDSKDIEVVGNTIDNPELLCIN